MAGPFKLKSGNNPMKKKFFGKFIEKFAKKAGYSDKDIKGKKGTIGGGGSFTIR